MAGIENFRSSLHGFNRNDVVQFIQQQTTAHEKALRAQREELVRLQEALNEARAENERLTEEKEQLLAQLEEANSTVETEPEESASALQAPIAPAATVVTTVPSDFNEMELAAYRRAEMTERMARERAAASAERMKSIFAQADEKLIITGRDIATVMDAFRNDYDQLQQLLTAVQGVVNESSSGLKAAADICNEP